MEKTPFDLFGVECGEGWRKLYQPLLDLAALYNIPVFQVKEKFGGLRFYVGSSGDVEKDQWMDAVIRAVETASFHTCEDCGEDGSEGWDEGTGKPRWKATTGQSGWIRTLCRPCREKWEEGRDGKKTV